MAVHDDFPCRPSETLAQIGPDEGVAAKETRHGQARKEHNKASKEFDEFNSVHEQRFFIRRHIGIIRRHFTGGSSGSEIRIKIKEGIQKECSGKLSKTTLFDRKSAGNDNTVVGFCFA